MLMMWAIAVIVRLRDRLSSRLFGKQIIELTQALRLSALVG